jgi:hypothetical protein
MKLLVTIQIDTVARTCRTKGVKVLEEDLPPDAEATAAQLELVAVSPQQASPFDQFWTQFWRMYPRKVGKDAAHRVAVRVAGKRREILSGLSEQLPKLHEQMKIDPSKVPHPATWLRAGRWMDEPDPAPAERRSKVDRLLEEA